MIRASGPPGSEPGGAGNLLIDGGSGRVTTWRELPERRYVPPTAVVSQGALDALPWVWRHAWSGEELLVVSASRLDPDLAEELGEEGFRLDGDREVPPRSTRAAEPGRLWLLTSGSTGRPKRVGHTLDTLATVTSEQEPRRWLCPYSPGTYAWWQVVTLSLTRAGQDVVFLEPAHLDRWTAVAADHGATAASGTPTFWRQTLVNQAPGLAHVPLSQVTLGGEPVDQAILDRLHEVLPHARISWIYASSEVGASIVVHDGRAGFPEAWLGRRTPGRPVLDVDGDELVVSSPHHGAGMSGPVHTGDKVEIVGGRVLITGRLSTDEINVGGTKVSAAAIRRVLQAHPAVVWADVTARRAPLVGRLVQATVVPVNGATADAGLEQELASWCRDRLAEAAVPRRFVWKASVPMKESLKSDV